MKAALSFFLLSCLLFSCAPKESELTSDFGDPDKLLERIQGDFMAWWTYHKKYTPLSDEFEAIDTKNKGLTKEAFFRQLLTGDYIPIKVYTASKEAYYKLYRLDGQADPSVASNIIDDAGIKYERLLWQGKPFPTFSFTDIEGDEYTSEDLKGKIVFIKTWFVNCAPCIKEMPALNEMKESFKERDNMVFLSLVLDDTQSVKKFLTKRDFDYAIVPNAGPFIQKAEVFGANPAYPTHVVVNEEGVIEKTVSSYEELENHITYSGL